MKIDPFNIISFRILEETTLTQLILLNRKRSGEVQRIFLKSYTDYPSKTSQDDITSTLSKVEQELTRQFKRIVIRGKRGRGVPILFTTKLQKVLAILVSIRENFVDEDNEYLFAIPNTPNSCLRASEIMKKMTICSGAKNPSALTSTKLRKQVATVAQILSFNEGDIEQLANFMGHSKEIHKTFYRLPENVYQVAKVSKFLLIMERGNTDKYRGMNIDEININVESLISDDRDAEEGLDINNPEIGQELTQSLDMKIKKTPKETTLEKSLIKKPTETASQKNRPNLRVSNKTSTADHIVHIEKKKKFDLIPWSNKQKAITTTHFQKHILLKKPPKKGECKEFIQKNKTVMMGKFTNKGIQLLIVLIFFFCFRKKLAKNQNIYL